MKNTFGNSVSVTLFGESHGEMTGVVIDGLAPGIAIDTAFIKSQLKKRRPAGKTGTARKEADDFRIISGVFEGKTTGTPVCIIIPNEKANSSDYALNSFIPRPGHADYTANKKYHGFEDYRGGGHFSGRLTAALTAAGAIAISALKDKGIDIGTHIARCAKIDDRKFKDLKADIDKLNSLDFAVLDDKKSELMREAIISAGADGDSVGGILETAVTGLPAGIGEPWFDSVESMISHAMFSVPAVKGIEFGNAFKDINLRGSEFNDSFRMEDGKIKTVTNHNAGINGGITNGMPVTFRLAVKPTPSIFREQKTVDMLEMKDTSLTIHGRHDPAVIHRARVVVDSLTALVLCDILALRYGTDWLGE
ncbi:MAG: chorismate synthase [Clostridia bacterium]|nr:chorismate synthase [Clostridia bacterium]